MHTGVWGKVGAAVLPLVTIAGVLALWQGQYVKFNLNTVRLHKLGLQKMAAQHAQLTVARPQLPPSPVPQQKLSVTQIPASSIKCDDAPWDHKICWVDNLYLAGDASAAIFVTNGSVPSFPPLKLFHLSHLAPHLPPLKLENLLHVVDHTQAAYLFASAAANASHEEGGARVWRFSVVDHVVAAHPSLLSNWWHTMDDVSNVAFRFCRYFGLCTHQQLREASTTVLLFNSIQLAHLRPPVRDAFSCMGSIQRLEMTASLGPSLLPREAAKSVRLLRTVLLGEGDTIMHHYLAEGLGKKSADNSNRARQFEMLRECAGLPTNAPPRELPTFSVVNRPYGTGRTVLGMGEALTKLEQMKPKGEQGFTLRRSFLAGMSFQEQEEWVDHEEQARFFFESDILFLPHGAAAANLIFLPPKAVVVHTAAMPRHLQQEQLVSRNLPKPMFRVEVVTLDSQGYTEPMVHKFFADPRFRALPAPEQLHLLQHCSIRDANTTRIMAKLYSNLSSNLSVVWHHAMFNINLRPGPDRLAQALLEGVRRWYAMGPS